MDCTICLDEVKRPTQLGCTHVFCLNCIVNWIMALESLNNLKCPLCRSFIDVLEYDHRKFYDTEIYFFVQTYQLVQTNPNSSKIDLFLSLQNELDELDMFDENFDAIVVMYVCLHDFLDVEFEFLKSLM